MPDPRLDDNPVRIFRRHMRSVFGGPLLLTPDMEAMLYELEEWCEDMVDGRGFEVSGPIDLHR